MTKNTSLHDLTISDFSCQSMLEKIEDKYDLEFLRQPITEDEGFAFQFKIYLMNSEHGAQIYICIKIE
ncbi:DUF6290 family protein [Streptococcus suis]|uniref:DUF6290 family protein n=1 Tax=Streptococcus suis TaxID=1307 RepID=UPI001E5BF2A9|nr:DUF6290 family protein [Streptococcus suis]